MKLKRQKKILLISLILAIVLTLFSELLINTRIQGVFPNLVFGGEPLIGVTYYGYPIPWMSQVVYPGSEKEIIWSAFILNILFRTVILFLILKLMRKKKLINL